MLQMHSDKKKMQMNSKGFTLIEVLIVMAIFSIGILAVAAMQMTSTRGNASAIRITEATALAENQIENLMQLSYDHNDLNPANNPHPGPQGGPYTMSWNVTEIDLDADGTNDSKAIDVTVGWSYGGDRDVSIQYIIPEY
jgi:prepilin-type N-terminal cleavage/methylation domain-containing protein